MDILQENCMNSVLEAKLAERDLHMKKIQAILQREQKEGQTRQSHFDQWEKIGGPCPPILLESALRAVRKYPGTLAEMGMKDPDIWTCWGHPSLAPTFKALPPPAPKAVMDQEFNGGDNTDEVKEFIERSREWECKWNEGVHSVMDMLKELASELNNTATILSRAAKEAGLDPDDVTFGVQSLIKAYSPMPARPCTIIGIEYPQDNSLDWPACMSVADREKMDERCDRELTRLRKVLDALSRSKTGPAGQKAESNKRTKGKQSKFIFERNGPDYWDIRYEGKDLKPIRHLQGMTYIQALLKNKGIPISCKELHELEHGVNPDSIKRQSESPAELEAQHGSGSETQWRLDKRAIKEIEMTRDAHHLKLQDPNLSDWQKKHLESEYEPINEELTRAKIKKSCKTFELKQRCCSRQAIAKAIDLAIKVIGARSKELARHLKGNLPKGKEPRYTGGITWDCR
jgi:hypothetical protein